MSENSGKKKAKKSTQQGVLGTLPATRPARVGRERTAAAKPAPAATKTARTKSSAANTKRRTAAEPAAAKTPRRPAPKPPPEPPPRHDGPPRGADLAVTAARAVGELAHIGASVSARVVKRAASRRPRP